MPEENTDPHRVVYKHRVRLPMSLDDNAIVITTVTLHAYAHLLSVVWQTGGVHVYEQHAVETRIKENREFLVVGTGHEFIIPRGKVSTFVGTCQEPSGYVWHVYEVKNY